MQLDNLYIGHWSKANKHAGYTAKNLMADFAVNFIQAHVHRMGVHYKKYLDRTVVGIENGCLCKLDPHFGAMTDWQHGFSHVTKIGKKYYIQPIYISEGEFVWDGHLWSAQQGRRVDGILTD